MRVSSEHAGRVARCPDCQTRFKVPGAKAQSAEPPAKSPPSKRSKPSKQRPRKRRPSEDSYADSKPPMKLPPRMKSAVKKGKTAAISRKMRASPEKLSRMVMSGFSGPVDPVPCGMLYRLGVAASACFVIFLPLLYVALVGLVAWGTYWHAVNNTWMAEMLGGMRGRMISGLLYVTPIGAGVICVLFMVKPLFVRPARMGGTASLNPETQPVLFEFVYKICEIVGAPRPVRIDVDLNVNASAGYGSGLISVVKSDLVLTIGMPLVAGMSLQQFAGVLAHEFGHFRQGGAMRVSYVVRTINYWFARVVYHRDAMDEFLIENSEDEDHINWIFYIIRFAVFLNRMILWCFMMVAHAVTCGLSRQMEYDADRYETRLVGTDTFRETCFRLNWLAYGLEDMYRNRYNWMQREDENLNPVRNFIQHCDSLSEHDQKRMKRRMKKSKTGLLDTHPADTDRIASAEQEDADGVFSSDLPAEAVFQQFDHLCLLLAHE